MATHVRTGTPDGTSGEKVASFALQEDSTIEAVAGIALSQQIGDAPSAHRSGLSAVDSNTDMSPTSFGTSLKTLNNAATLAVWCTFANAAGSATVFLVFYDGSGTAVALFKGPEMSFTAGAERLTAAGNYMSEVKLCDSYGAKKVKAFLKVMGTGNVDIYVEGI